MQRAARFFLWMGLALLSIGLFGMILSCGSQIGELSTDNVPTERNIGGAVSLLLIALSLLFVAAGAVLKAIARDGSEWPEEND